MKMSNVDWKVLQMPGKETLLSRFLTEVQEGVALTAGHGLVPENVTISLVPEKDLVYATIHPPKTVDIGHLRSSMAANAFKIAEGTLHSVQMMRGVEEIQSGRIGVS